uniref:UNC93-like protein n=1 Tax=Timema tahoe TaxID=61484 RepID=A0A7R9II42_9NEOP|nr:unnamed protein product [Timema tahoe]
MAEKQVCYENKAFQEDLLEKEREDDKEILRDLKNAAILPDDGGKVDVVQESKRPRRRRSVSISKLGSVEIPRQKKLVEGVRAKGESIPDERVGDPNSRHHKQKDADADKDSVEENALTFELANKIISNSFVYLSEGDDKTSKLVDDEDSDSGDMIDDSIFDDISLGGNTLRSSSGGAHAKRAVVVGGNGPEEAPGRTAPPLDKLFYGDRIWKVYHGQNGGRFQGMGTVERVTAEDGCTLMRHVAVLSVICAVIFLSVCGCVSVQGFVVPDATTNIATFGALYGAMVFSNLFLTAVSIKWLGCEVAVVVFPALYVPYAIAQFFPALSTLMPTAILMGLASAPFWVARGVYLSRLSRLYARVTGSTPQLASVHVFSAFFSLFSLWQVVESLVTTSVLPFAEVTNATVMEVGGCGVDACPQDFKIDTSHLLWYVTSDTNILSGVYLGLILLALLLGLFCIENLDIYDDQRKQEEGSWVTLLVSTIKHLQEGNQLLLMPIMLWFGVNRAYVVEEYLQTYVSCMSGVERIGYITVCYGVASSLAALLCWMLAAVIRRAVMIVVATLANLAVLATLLLWKPEFANLIVLCGVMVISGLANGTWAVNINALCGSMFPGDEVSAYSHLMMWESLGYLVAAVFSARLCTDVKLYISLALLVVGSVTYSFVEWGQRGRRRSVEKLTEL